MEYSNEIVINVSRQTLVELLINPEIMKKWSPNLKSFELLEGSAQTKGAKSKMVFDTENGEMTMIETILEFNFPEKYNLLYETPGMKNWSKNEFIAISPKQTQWNAHNIFEFEMKIQETEEQLIKRFSTQTMEDMKHFKDFAESNDKSF